MFFILFHNAGSLEPWYLQARQELIGKYSTQVIDGKKHQTWSSGKIEPTEMLHYKQLMKDIQKYANFRSIRTRGILKALLLPF